ncbi:hypothetical protein [Bradyrhizobium algeriense]|nr:hypothetical protein [Bradyrhizobium algeriense]
MGGKADDADTNIRALIFALLALACGHMLSTLLRTIPAFPSYRLPACHNI